MGSCSLNSVKGQPFYISLVGSTHCLFEQSLRIFFVGSFLSE